MNCWDVLPILTWQMYLYNHLEGQARMLSSLILQSSALDCGSLGEVNASLQEPCFAPTPQPPHSEEPCTHNICMVTQPTSPNSIHTSFLASLPLILSLDPRSEPSNRVVCLLESWPEKHFPKEWVSKGIFTCQGEETHLGGVVESLRRVSDWQSSPYRRW